MSASLLIAALAAAGQPAEELPPACTPRAIVFFDPGSATVTPEAGGMLQNFAAGVTRDGRAYEVTLRGHADRVGSEAANLDLSRRRAEAVRDYLAAYGVLASRIVLAALGEASPLVPTADGVPERQNRFVEVVAQIRQAEMERREANWRRSGRPRPIC